MQVNASLHLPMTRAAALLIIALALGVPPFEARAHDPSAFGGLFRTRNAGASWFVAHPSGFPTGAIALAISPADPNHLLLATDNGLLRSRNGGLDWRIEQAGLTGAPVFAATFRGDGQRAIISAASVLLRSDGEGWRPLRPPSGATPARAIVNGPSVGCVYLAGWTGLYRSDDWGDSWISIGEGLPDEPVTALLVSRAATGGVFAIAGGALFVSRDAGQHWEPRTLPAAPVQALTGDPEDPALVWAVAGGQMFRSADASRWQPVGRPLPQTDTAVRAVAVTGTVYLLGTELGVYRGIEGGSRWELLADNLPAHIEAGMLVHDPTDPKVLYAGFALVTTDELLRQAAEGRSALSRLSATTLGGGLAFLSLFAGGGVLMVRWLRTSSTPSQPVSRSPRR